MKFLKQWLAKKQQLHFVMTAAKRYLHADLARDLFHALLHSVDASKNIHTPKGHAASHLPICLVLGASQSGKSALLGGSQMVLTESKLLNHAYQPIKGLSIPQHYLTPHCLFVELPQYFLVNESAKQIPYLEQLLLCWKKFGYLDRIEQLVITVRVSDLFNHHKTAEKMHEEFWHSLQLFLSHLTRPHINIVIVVTQVDQLQGFTEFFTDLSVEERQHSFGFALKSSQEVLISFQNQMMNLLKRLQRRMLWRCQAEHILARRLLIAEFPKQFEALTTSLADYLQPLMNFLPSLPNVKLKACFFTSALQRGEPLDWLLENQNYAADFEGPKNTLPMVPQERTYFIRGVFQYLRGNKPLVLAAPKAQKKEKPWWQKFLLASIFGLVFLIGLCAMLVWVHIEHVLEKHPALAYQIVASEYADNNLQNFVDYEIPYLPISAQRAIAQSSSLRFVVNDSARTYLQERWRQEVYQVYEKRLANRYPLVTNASEDVNWDAFNTMYAPNGLLAQFNTHYLQQPAVRLLIQSEAVDALTKALAKFSHLLYQPSQANVALTIYPNTFAENVTGVNLLLQGNKISLKPHAIIAASFTWPSQAASKQSGLLVEYNHTPGRAKIFVGDWSWMRLLQTMSWRADATPNSYIVTGPLQQFSMQVSSNIPMLELFNLFPQLVIPESL